ncbi:DUF7563 family protein [Halopiger thermotolerans]
MNECNRCGAHVTSRFVRVFGTNSGEINGCPNCMSYRELASGDGVQSDSQ